eukprot:Skav223294  [mRNA]  locus=scaffold2998:131354:133662:+ [translate_table: standard]
MGFSKLQRRSSTKVIDVSDEDTDRSTDAAASCKNQVYNLDISCDRKVVSPRSPVDLDEPGTPAKAEPKPQAGPDFLGTPVSSRLPRTNSVRVLKLRSSPDLGVSDRKAVPKPKAQCAKSGFVQSLKRSRAVHLATSETSKPGHLSPISRSVAPLVSPSRKSKHFRRREASILDCDELLGDVPGNRAQGKRPPVALVIKKRWCDKIFEGGKIWEIRGTPLTKRGRICIAQSKSKMLVGEVEVVDCLKVGRKVDGRLVPWSLAAEDVRNFIGAPENLPKHCVEDLNWVPYSKAMRGAEWGLVGLSGADPVFAWVLDKKLRYEQPEPYRHKPGCIQWVKLEPGTEANRTKGSRGSKGRDALLQCPTPPRAVPNLVTLRPPSSTEPGGWLGSKGKTTRLVDDDDSQLCQTTFLDDDPDVNDVIKPRFVEDDGASSDPIEDVD